MSFYLKYRPRLVEDLDLVRVRESLTKILKSGNVPKSLLFVGPRGGGKTSAARIIAKVVNCQEQGKGKRDKDQGLSEPCLECESCLSIERGAAIDVIEMDAASNRGIDAIRELRERINLAPVNAKFKVYIIDEVHMLTTEAFNALLKTLEEPPTNTLFILCTTEEQKVPETIRSRTTKIQFYKAGVEEVKRSLNKVIKGEGLKVSEEALNALAEGVDGSLREGHKLLELLASLHQDVGVGEVAQVLGTVADVNVLTDWLISGDSAKALSEIERLSQLGVDWQTTVRAMLDYLRVLVKAYFGVGEEQAAWDVSRLMLVVKRLAVAAVEMKTAMIEQLPLEIAAVELGIDKQTPLAKSEIQKQAKEERAMEEEEKPKVSTVVMQPEIGDQRPKIREKRDVSLAEVQEKWQEILKLLKPKNHSVAGLLRSAKPKAVEDRFLVLEVFYQFHKEQLEQDAKRRVLEETLGETVGLPAVKFILGHNLSESPRAVADAELTKSAEEVFGG